jgi:hypothetical protein
MNYHRLKDLQQRHIAPSDTHTRRLVKEGKISPPLQRVPGGKRIWTDDHVAEFLGLQKPKAATA